MKWSDIKYDSEFYIPFDENQRAIRGFLLTQLDVDLNCIPHIFNEPFQYIEGTAFNNTQYEQRKVYLSDIIGTSYKDYGGSSIIQAYLRIKRASGYIKAGMVTRNKYFRMLKDDVKKQSCPVELSQIGEQYFVNGNGNHRIVLYKIIMLAEIAQKYEWACSDDYDVNYDGFHDIRNKYWLNARVSSNHLGGEQHET